MWVLPIWSPVRAALLSQAPLLKPSVELRRVSGPDSLPSFLAEHGEWHHLQERSRHLCMGPDERRYRHIHLAGRLLPCPSSVASLRASAVCCIVQICNSLLEMHRHVCMTVQTAEILSDQCLASGVLLACFCSAAAVYWAPAPCFAILCKLIPLQYVASAFLQCNDSAAASALRSLTQRLNNMFVWHCQAAGVH